MIKRLIIISAFILFVLPGVVLANMDKYLPSEKAWALQFAVDQDFRLNSFNGATISLLKHKSLNSAWRFGVTMRGGFEDTDQEDDWDDGNSASIEGDSHNFDIALDMIKISYPNTSSKINVFYGLGPSFGFRSTKNEIETIRDDIVYNEIHITSMTQWRFGGKIILGTQWVFAKGIALHAEYGSSILYNYEKRKTETFYTTNTDDDRRISERIQKGIQFNFIPVRLGISVYF